MAVVQALGILIAAAYVVLNLLADVATILINPRLGPACDEQRRHRRRLPLGRFTGGRRPAQRHSLLAKTVREAWVLGE